MKSAPRTNLMACICILLGTVVATTTLDARTTAALAFQPQKQQCIGGRTVPQANGACITPPFRSAWFLSPSRSIRRAAFRMIPRDVSSYPSATVDTRNGAVIKSSDPARGTRTPVSHSHLKNAFATALLSSVLVLGAAQPSMASYGDGDTNSPAVESAITALRQAKGSSSDTFKAFESIGDIITEGKGVGGSINYKGVQLERGYVADEDTTIYNPGLTLLTETEKTNLAQAVIEARANGLTDGSWNDDNQLAYEFLKDKLDPLHMAELKGYLSVFPVVVGVAYVTTLAVQQLVRDLFPVAYVVGVLLIIAPALALVALGP